MKRSWMGFVCLAAGLMVMLPASLQAQRNKKEPLVPASEEEYKALKKVKKLVAKVVAADEKELVFKLEFKSVEVDSQKVIDAQKKAIANAQKQAQNAYRNAARPNYNRGGNRNNQGNMARQMMRLQQQMAQLQRIRDPREKQRRYAQLMQQVQRLKQQQMRQQLQLQRQYAQQMQRQQQQIAQKIKQAQKNASSSSGSTGVYDVKVTGKDFEVPVAEDVIVRRLNLPFSYDDKGNVKKYTAEDLKKLKGDSGLPGYEASMSDLEAGQTIQIVFGKSKEKKGINLGLEKNRDAPTVTAIVILAEVGSPLNGKK